MLKKVIRCEIALLLAVGASTVLAQMGTGRVTGTVKDPQGKPIAGAKVSATIESERPLEATTDKDGKWAVLGFRSGTYDFSFTAEGYQPQSYKNAVKQMGRNPSMDIVLQPLKQGQGSGAAGGKLTAANQLFDQKQYKEAIAQYEELLAQEPTLYQIHYNIGSAYRQMGEFDKALESFKKVLDQEPNNTAALVATGDVLIGQNKLDDAVTYFEKALDQTKDEVIPFNVGEIYFTKGNTAKAIEYYQKAADRKPDWPEPYLKMAYAQLNAGNMDAATKSFEKVVELSPDSPQGQQAKQALSALKK